MYHRPSSNKTSYVTKYPVYESPNMDSFRHHSSIFTLLIFLDSGSLVEVPKISRLPRPMSSNLIQYVLSYTSMSTSLFSAKDGANKVVHEDKAIANKITVVIITFFIAI